MRVKVEWFVDSLGRTLPRHRSHAALVCDAASSSSGRARVYRAAIRAACDSWGVLPYMYLAACMYTEYRASRPDCVQAVLSRSVLDRDSEDSTRHAVVLCRSARLSV